jgi:hypothetical protein
MKFTLFIVFGLFFLTISTAQITLRRVDYSLSTISKDSTRSKLLTQAGASIPASGNNQIWDYSFLTDSSSEIFVNYTLPAATFGTPPPEFNDANLAYNYSIIFQTLNFPARAYERVDSSGYHQLGYFSNGGRFSTQSLTGGISDSLIFPATSTRYAQLPLIYKFPMTANTLWKSDFQNVVNFQSTIRAIGYDKKPGTRVSNYAYRDTILGWGTLKMRNPSGGAPLNFAVLLDYFTGSRIDSFFLEGTPALNPFLAAYGLQQGRTIVFTPFYQFLGVGYSEPLLSMLASTTGRIFSINRAVLPNLGLTVATNEANLSAIKTQLFPNPTLGKLTLTFEKSTSKPWYLMVYNNLGQIICLSKIDNPEGNLSHTLDLNSSLPNGTYFYNLLDENSLIRSHGQVQLMR